MYLEQNLLCFPVQVSLNWVIMGVIAIEFISIMLVFQSIVWVVTIFAKQLRNFLLKAVHALNIFSTSLPFKKNTHVLVSKEERRREREREKKKMVGEESALERKLSMRWGVYIGFATSEMRKILWVLELVVSYYWSLEAFGILWRSTDRILCKYIYIYMKWPLIYS